MVVWLIRHCEKCDSYTLKTDSFFHLRIAKASGNAVLFGIMKYIIGLSDERLWETIREELVQTPGHLEKDLRYHEDIVRCLKNKDCKNARS